MDWSKVIENLRAQSTFYAKNANDLNFLSGHHESVGEYRRNADIASILAEALQAGLDPKEGS